MKKYTPCTLICFDVRAKKRYQIDAIGKDFVYLHEFVKNGQIIFAPVDCEVVVFQGF